MNETLILTQILTGVVGGLVYVLLALGLTLIFGFMGVVNFAHGSFYMVGAYVGLAVADRLGAGFWPALLVVPIPGGLLGAPGARTVLRPLYSRKEDEPPGELSADMGLLMIIFAFVTVVVGGMGSYWGAVAGGLLIGVVYSLTSLFAQQFAQVAVFSLMALVLLVRPRGLLGTA